MQLRLWRPVPGQGKRSLHPGQGTDHLCRPDRQPIAVNDKPTVLRCAVPGFIPGNLRLTDQRVARQSGTSRGRNHTSAQHFRRYASIANPPAVDQQWTAHRATAQHVRIAGTPGEGLPGAHASTSAAPANTRSTNVFAQPRYDAGSVIRSIAARSSREATAGSRDSASVSDNRSVSAMSQACLTT
jgi:hypothetical protein